MSEQSFGPSRGNFYTASRNVQELIGKLPDGTYIWGGPYTVPQVFAGVIAFAVTLAARQIGLWGGALIFDLLVILALSVGVIYLVGKMPPPKRSIFGLVSGTINLLTAPDTGQWKGRALPSPRPPKNSPSKEGENHIGANGSGNQTANEVEDRAVGQEDSEPMCGLDLLLAQHKR